MILHDFLVNDVCQSLGSVEWVTDERSAGVPTSVDVSERHVVLEVDDA